MGIYLRVVEESVPVVDATTCTLTFPFSLEYLLVPCFFQTQQTGIHL